MHGRPLLRDMVFSALCLGNWTLIRQGQDDLARDEAASLAQHFQAVSLIAQACAVWHPPTGLADGASRLRRGWMWRGAQ